ncbi:MAG: MarR family transcriptional regulator [Candidatus Electrothrix sp. ATG2]|nr:MarR family transcriptional regulator [Candidatus Electrothrix sp. ATG2]
MSEQDRLTEVRIQLVETGGRTSQELGAGRIVGQIMVYLYLQKDAQSLDSIGEALALSKASVSIAVRQLEQLGLVRRAWIKGDRKKYYRSADNIGSGLQQGLLSFLRQKVQFFGTDLEGALTLLESLSPETNDREEFLFLQQRVNRASKLQKILLKILGNPLVNFLAKNIK